MKGGTLPPCRSCGQVALEVFLSLGKTPLANSLLGAEDLVRPEATYPLDVAFCHNCSLVQITTAVPPEELFSDYPYFSSYSDTVLEQAADIADRLRRSRGLNEKSLVAEVASNDGYLLQFYQRHKVPVYGVEPAENVARVAREERQIPTLTEFFGDDVAVRLVNEGSRADVIHANNVLAHVPDLNGFVKGIGRLLKPDGVAVIEVPYVKELIERCEFDTIYHEHLCYFSLTTLHRLVARHGLVVQDVEPISIHGGSLRLTVGRPMQTEGAGRVAAVLRDEKAAGVPEMSFYREFAHRVEGLRSSLVELLMHLKGEGKRLAAYGAAAKGSTLLNFFGIGGDVLDYVVDRSPHKQGRFMPGVRLPIFAPSKLLEDMPDFVLLLAWNLADEVMAQQGEYRSKGGRFILPVPDVKVV